jgi:hypothetical protein
MEELKSLWDRIEKKAIYGVLLVFFVLQLISVFIPALSGFMDTRGALILVTLALLFIFRHLDQRMREQPKIDFIVTVGFTQGVLELLKGQTKYNQIDIFGYSSLMYFSAFRESGVKAENVRLLLHNPDSMVDIQFPIDEDAKAGLRSQIKDVLISWRRLQSEDRIDNLSIRFYSFDTISHFMIIDGEKLHFGLFKPVRKHPATELIRSFIAYPGSDPQSKLVKYYKEKFETIWGEFAVPSETTVSTEGNSHR